MIDNKIVGRKIASMRQESGLTQQQLAAMMNVSHQAVSKWESGQTLPDIQTLLELTRFFGLTVEQLIADPEEIPAEDAYTGAENADTISEESAPVEAESEGSNMNLQQLLQMAPYMSKETVEQIVLELEEPLTANQIARIAPYIRPECLEKLIERHHPEFTWESLRRIAPYMRREAVDALAKDVASGKETIRPASENINKALGDLGKAFDDLGHDMKHAVKKGLRFGKNVLKEVSSALSERGCESSKPAEPAPVRSERAVELRKKAFERAAADGKWDWIAQHIDELDADAQLRGSIAASAREAGMHEWIFTYMGAYAEEATIEAAIDGGNWEWLGTNVSQMEVPMQQKVALAACDAQNWDWLSANNSALGLGDCALQIATEALNAAQGELAVQMAENHLLPEQASQLAMNAYEAAEFDILDRLIVLSGDETADCIVKDLAASQQWDVAAKYLHFAGKQTVEELMELAVDQGNFDAVDLLDQYL